MAAQDADRQIVRAIARGADHLIGLFDEKGRLPILPPPRRYVSQIDACDPDPAHAAGQYALCVYALTQCGQALHDERLDIHGRLGTLIDTMKSTDAGGLCTTYVRGVRAAALAVHNRPEDRAVLRADVAYLVINNRGGCYTYGQPAPATAPAIPVDRSRWYGDNSNAQFGLLGVCAGVPAGMAVPSSYWGLVHDHWANCQFANGQWGYGPRVNGQILRLGPGPLAGGATCSMTLAGIASLLAIQSQPDVTRHLPELGAPPFDQPLARGIQWLEQGGNCIVGLTPGSGGWGGGYDLFAIQRIGLASGLKYFGSHDWYREGASLALKWQHPDGSFGDPVETAFCLLFLASARQSVAINKLRFDGAWANRPRDLANLTNHVGHELERPMRWQIVPIQRDWTDWTDAPILYLASHDKVSITDDQVAKIRKYLDAGGLLFTHADGARPAFTTFALDLGRRLYPDAGWADLPMDHAIYRRPYRVDPPLRIKCLSRGGRILILHSPDDLAQFWHTRAEGTHRNAFDFGANLIFHMTRPAQ